MEFVQTNRASSLRPRIIPCLLIHDGGLVKTRKFVDPKYVGDPINAVRIFNEKEVDELIVIDIDATRKNSDPDYSLIAKLAVECRMPLCYGGGIKDEFQVDRIISLGVEKVAISSAAVTNPEVISKSAARVGNQSVVVVLDVKKTGLLARYEVVTHNATVRTGKSPFALASEMDRLGAGEIVVNSVDRDGEMAGYDLELVANIRRQTNLPVTVLGGAGNVGHLEELIHQEKIIGAAAGSLFVFKGRFRAVLINYPNRTERDALVTRTLAPR